MMPANPSPAGQPPEARSPALRLWAASVSRLDMIGGALLSALLPLLFFWPLWTPNLADRLLIVKGDFTHQYYPLRAFAARMLAAGHLPLWNPQIYGGQPALADPQMAVLYPPNLITALIMGHRFSLYVLEWQVIAHFMLAGLFMFCFVYRRTGKFWAAELAAIAFTFGGYLTSFPVQQVTILETVIWLPLVLLFLDWGLDGIAPGRVAQGAILAGLALGLAMLAGHPQTALYVFYVGVAYALWRWFETQKRSPDMPSHAAEGAGAARRPWPTLLLLALFPVVALGSAAVQWLPTAEFIGLSSRRAATYTFASTGLSWHELSVLLLPNFFGGSPLYAGVIALTLAGWGLLATHHGRERWFWGILALLALLLALGGNSFLYSLFYLGVPGFAQVRDQERALALFALAVAMLAGLGAQSLLGPLPGWSQRRLRLFHRWLGRVWLLALLPAGFLYILRARALAGGGGGDAGILEAFLDRYVFLLVIVALAWGLLLAIRRQRNSRLMVAALTLVLLFELFTVNWHYNIGAKTAQNVFPPSAATAWLQSHASDGRIASAGKLPAGDNAGLIYAWEDTTGNDPLRLQQTVQFAKNVDIWQRWRLLHVAYVVSRKPLHDDGLAFRFSDNRVAVYELSDPLPFAWLVHDVVTREDGPDTWKTLNDPQFDLQQTAVVEPPAASSVAGFGRAGSAPDDRVSVVARENERLILDVEADGPAFLILSQVFYPGWQARLDGAGASLYRADGLLQGMIVPAGKHRVEVAYRPSSFIWGLLITLLTLAGCAAALGWLWRDRQRREGR